MLDVEYVAGFFDGEGCVCIRRHTDNGGRSWNYELIVKVTNARRDIIDQFQNEFGGRVAVCHRMPYSDQYSWYAYEQGKLAFLLSILPYLVVKRSEVLLALEFMEFKKSWYNKRSKPQWAHEKFECYRRELSSLKGQKGCRLKS